MRITATIVAMVLATGCAQMTMFQPRAAVAPVRESPVGRWDAVMALEPAALISVVTADGNAHTGRFVRAGMYWLRIYEHSAELEIPRDDVARVDFLAGVSGDSTLKRMALGAAFVGGVAAGYETYFGMAFGGKFDVPWRTLAVGAAAGAAAGAIGGAVEGRVRARPIYIAPQLVGR